METQTRPGVIAVDPAVIPLGSKVKIQNRIYSAEDTGRDIIGRHIDIFMCPVKDALKWGVQQIKLIVVKKGNW